LFVVVLYFLKKTIKNAQKNLKKTLLGKIKKIKKLKNKN